MATFNFNGIKFEGTKFEIKNGIFYVDNEPVYKQETKDNDILSIEGNGVLYCDGMVIIEGSFKGEIIADKVIINGEHNGEITANKINNNN